MRRHVSEYVQATQPAEQHPPSPHTPIDASARAEDSTQHHVDTSTGTVAPSTVRRMDGSILEVDLSGANNVGEARRRVAAAADKRASGLASSVSEGMANLTLTPNPQDSMGLASTPRVVETVLRFGGFLEEFAIGALY